GVADGLQRRKFRPVAHLPHAAYFLDESVAYHLAAAFVNMTSKSLPLHNQADGQSGKGPVTKAVVSLPLAHWYTAEQKHLQRADQSHRIVGMQAGRGSGVYAGQPMMQKPSAFTLLLLGQAGT